MWERVSQFLEKKHPEKVATDRASKLFDDICLSQGWAIVLASGPHRGHGS